MPLPSGLASDDEPAGTQRPAEDASLWTALGNGDTSAREAIIAAHIPFARMLAAKMFANRIDHDLEFDEYFQFATLGMIEAVDRFDVHRKILFRTYAAHRITGTIRNGLEHLSEKRAQIATRQRLMEERRNSGKALFLNDSRDIFQQLADMAIGLALGCMLDEAAASYHQDAIQTDNIYSATEMRQLREQVLKLVDSLPSQEKSVIKHHYLQQQSFSEVAAGMGLSKGRVSQIHGKALQRLRELHGKVNRYDVAW